MTCDLSKADVQDAVAIHVQACDAAIWGVDCSTLSRAREVAIPGHHAAPKPLRAENESCNMIISRILINI